MRLATALVDGERTVTGWIEGEHLIGAAEAARWFDFYPVPGAALEELLGQPLDELRAALGPWRPAVATFPLAELRLLAPIPRPRTIRDFYAFEAHVRNARARRGLPMLEAWYEAPVFYFSNPNAVYGPEEVVPKPRRTAMLDFELEVAAVIGRTGRDIPAAEAESYIAGYMIMNDWSARDIQAREMRVGLGPAKGKDFATSFGPWLVTPDELADRRRPDGRLDLTMVARINGQEVSRGNLAEMHFPFAQLIERASQDCTLYPGEIIGSGTVGTGCLLETEAHRWLEPGDVVELEVEGLGLLRNQIG
ncbi:MAG: fumarylacetoacetate hydrolase family protein [Bacillota bacterium]